MCGIAGIVDLNTQSSITESLLKKMSDIIRHRGPDDDGQWISDNKKCGLSFRRLSIIDLSSAGHQPMSEPTGRYTIVFNGEIYNHERLRPDFEAKGYRYKSRTDTETILYGYKEYGADFLHKMIGMWNLAIWDSERNELFCARDRIGVKPLYYTYRDGRFIFGSEIKSILQHSAVSKEMNYGEMTNYLAFSMTSEQSTLFEGIHKLPAGHFLRLKSDGTITIQRYWSPLSQKADYTPMSEQEIINEIMRLLRQAVKDRMMSDVPFGVFLSGGVDSSTNVALMAELMDRPVDTFSVGFKELEKYNEMEYARQVASIFKTNHHEILIDHNDALPVLEDLVWHEDEPNGDPVCIPLYFLSKLTREAGTTVIQVGEGSDEQFVGYPWMVREYKFYRSYWRYFTSMPQFLRSGIYSMAKPLLTKRGQFLALDYIRRGAEGDELYWGGAATVVKTFQEQLLSSKNFPSLNAPGQMLQRIYSDARTRQSDVSDFFQRTAFFELSQRLPELLLMRVDKMTMAHSLEARVPFLDSRLVEFTMTIPPHYRIKKNYETKHLLKKGVEGLLPYDIIYRRKQGFDAPIKEWIRGDWYTYILGVFKESRLTKDKIWNYNFIEHLMYQHKNSVYNHSRQLFNLLNLALWYKKMLC